MLKTPHLYHPEYSVKSYHCISEISIQESFQIQQEAVASSPLTRIHARQGRIRYFHKSHFYAHFHKNERVVLERLCHRHICSNVKGGRNPSKKRVSKRASRSRLLSRVPGHFARELNDPINSRLKWLAAGNTKQAFRRSHFHPACYPIDQFRGRSIPQEVFDRRLRFFRPTFSYVQDAQQLCGTDIFAAREKRCKWRREIFQDTISV